MDGPSISNSKQRPSTATRTIKFLCSYGGKILPRYPDGKLRYYGGETRLLAVDCNISFPELLVKLGELCGTPVTLIRCQLPRDDLDALVLITSDEDLANLLEEYDGTANLQSSLNFKIRSFLSLPKKSSPGLSLQSSLSYSPSRSLTNKYNYNCTQQMLKPSPKLIPSRHEKSAGILLRYACQNSIYWQ